MYLKLAILFMQGFGRVAGYGLQLQVFLMLRKCSFVVLYYCITQRCHVITYSSSVRNIRWQLLTTLFASIHYYYSTPVGRIYRQLLLSCCSLTLSCTRAFHTICHNRPALFLYAPNSQILQSLWRAAEGFSLAITPQIWTNLDKTLSTSEE